MNCMNCGAPLPNSAQFCFRCGTRVGATAPGAAPAASITARAYFSPTM